MAQRPRSPRLSRFAWQQEIAPDGTYGLPTLPPLPLLPQPTEADEGDSFSWGPTGDASAGAALTPEEEQSLLGRTLSAVGYLGGSLAKPGYAVRGLAAGEPTAALNLVPFYDTLRKKFGDPSWMPEAPKISGEELLADRWGVMQKPEGWFTNQGADFARKVAGLGVEFVDPLMLVGGPFGSLTGKGVAKIAGAAKPATEFGAALGQAAEKIAGQAETGTRLLRTPAALAEQIRAGERGIFSLGLPWKKEPLKLFGKEMVFGAGSEKIARGMEKLGYSPGSPFPWLRSVFSHVPGVGGQTLGAAQMAADLKFIEKVRYLEAMQDLTPAAMTRAADLKQVWDDAAKAAGKAGDTLAYTNFTRWASEYPGGIPDPNAIMAEMGQRLGRAAVGGAAQRLGGAEAAGKLFYGYFDGLMGLQNQAKTRLGDLGFDIKELDDLYGQHMGRRISRVVLKARQKEYKLAGVPERFRMEKHRAGYVRDFPGMSEGVNLAVTDLRLMGAEIRPDGSVTKLATEPHKAQLRSWLNSHAIPFPENMGLEKLQRVYLLEAHILPKLAELQKAGVLAPETYAAEVARFSGPAETVTTKGAATVTTEVPSHAAEIVADFNKLPVEVVQTGLFNRSLVEDTFDYLKSAAEIESNLQATHHFLSGPGLVKLASEVAPTDNYTPLAGLWTEKGQAGGLGLSERGLQTWVDRYRPGADPKDLMVLPQAGKALKAFRALRDPQVGTLLGDVMNKVSRPYKMWQTLAPSFYVRNLGGGFWNNAADGELTPRGVLRLAKNMRVVWDALWHGKRHPLLDEAANWGVLGEGGGQMLDILGAGAEDVLAPGPLGGALPEFGRVFTKQYWREGEGVKGKLGKVWELISSREGPIGAAHRRIHGRVEAIVRGSYYITLCEQGMTPAQAAAAVARTQFDYGKASPFEQKWMRPLVLYYGWLRNNIPLQISRLIERPGGTTGQALRLMAKAPQKEQEGYTPSFLRESLGLQLPWGTPEATQFLMQSGLPVEDLNKFIFQGGVPAWQRTAEKLLSQMHPIPVGGVEQFTGKQLYSGRQIKDLKSTTASYGLPETPIVDRLLHYSPWARDIYGMRKWMDERKPIPMKIANFLTGLRLGTYDVEKMRLTDLKRAQQEIARENPIVREFTEGYIPKSTAEELKKTPAGQVKLREGQVALAKGRAIEQAIRKLSKRRARQELVAQ